MQRLKSINWQYYLLFLLNTVIIYALMFHKGIILGWDSQFHLNRIEELYRSLSSGHILASNGSFTFSQIGLAVNKFYPYLFLYPFAIMRGLINPIEAYNICLFFLTFISFLLSYKSIDNIVELRNPVQQAERTGFLFSLIFNNSGYLLLQFTQRGDIAEYIALMLLPMLIMGIANLLWSAASKRWLLVPISLSLIAYSHILSSVLFTLFTVVILGSNYRQLNKVKVIRLAISAFIVVVATLPVSLTIIISDFKNKVITPIVPDTLQNEALKPSDLIINSLNTIVPNALTEVNIGVIVLISALISLLSSWNHDRLSRQLGVIGFCSLFISTNLFPWFIFQHTPLHVIQFPWRFLGIATFCFSYTAAVILQPKIESKGFLISVFLIINLVTFNYIHSVTHNIMDQTLTYQHIEKYKQTATDAVYTDYMPQQTFSAVNGVANFRNKTDIHRHIAYVNGHRVKLRNGQIKPGYNRLTYRLTGLKPNRLNHVTLPLLNYGNNQSEHGIITKQTKRGTTSIFFKPERNTQTVTIYLN